MAHPIPTASADAPPSPYFDSLLVFLGPPALGFEAHWAAFQQAAGTSVAAARAHAWWGAEEQLFAAITEAKDGEEPALDRILSLGLGRLARTSAQLHLVHHRNQWVPAVAIPLEGVRDGNGVPVEPREVVAAGSRIAAGLGLALARTWVEWIAPRPGQPVRCGDPSAGPGRATECGPLSRRLHVPAE